MRAVFVGIVGAEWYLVRSVEFGMLFLMVHWFIVMSLIFGGQCKRRSKVIARQAPVVRRGR